MNRPMGAHSVGDGRGAGRATMEGPYEHEVRGGRDTLEEAPLGEVLSQLGEDVSELFSAQVRMAAVEIKEDVQQAGRVGAMFGAASVAAFLAALLLLFAAAWGLAEVMPEGVAFLIVGAVVAIAAAVLFAVARSRARQLDPVPHKTVQTVKEDVQWLRQQTS